MSKRLTLVKRLYKGATLEDAVDDVGMSQSTGSRWAKLWNKGGLGLLPPKLNDKQRERLLDLLEDGEPWKKQEIQHLINTEFDVEFHPNYLPRLLDDLGPSYAIPRIESPNRPDNAAEILDERVQQVRGVRLCTQQFKWEHCVRVTRRVTLARYAFTAIALLDQQSASEERALINPETRRF